VIVGAVAVAKAPVSAGRDVRVELLNRRDETTAVDMEALPEILE
jgi:hypothetical protein